MSSLEVGHWVPQTQPFFDKLPETRCPTYEAACSCAMPKISYHLINTYRTSNYQNLQKNNSVWLMCNEVKWSRAKLNEAIFLLDREIIIRYSGGTNFRFHDIIFVTEAHDKQKFC